MFYVVKQDKILTMETLAVLSVITGILSSLIIAIDLLKHKQSMKIMNSVWILTALWSGVLGLIAYFRFGREMKPAQTTMLQKVSENQIPVMAMPAPDNSEHTDSTIGMKMEHMPNMQTNAMASGTQMPTMTMPEMEMPMRPNWESITLSTLHCGAGCTLADLIGEWFLFFVAVKIGGSLLIGGMVVDYILALSIGVYFQAAAIKSMDHTLSVKQRFVKAFKADVLSLTSWQIGMYGFMALVFFVIFPHQQIEQTSWLFWFMMQIAMLFGFLVAYPMNIFLIHAGIKKSM